MRPLGSKTQPPTGLPVRPAVSVDGSKPRIDPQDTASSPEVTPSSSIAHRLSTTDYQARGQQALDNLENVHTLLTQWLKHPTEPARFARRIEALLVSVQHFDDLRASGPVEDQSLSSVHRDLDKAKRSFKPLLTEIQALDPRAFSKKRKVQDKLTQFGLKQLETAIASLVGRPLPSTLAPTKTTPVVWDQAALAQLDHVAPRVDVDPETKAAALRLLGDRAPTDLQFRVMELDEGSGPTQIIIHCNSNGEPLTPSIPEAAGPQPKKPTGGLGYYLGLSVGVRASDLVSSKIAVVSKSSGRPGHQPETFAYWDLATYLGFIKGILNLGTKDDLKEGLSQMKTAYAETIRDSENWLPALKEKHPILNALPDWLAPVRLVPASVVAPFAALRNAAAQSKLSLGGGGHVFGAGFHHEAKLTGSGFSVSRPGHASFLVSMQPGERKDDPTQAWFVIKLEKSSDAVLCAFVDPVLDLVPGGDGLKEKLHDGLGQIPGLDAGIQIGVGSHHLAPVANVILKGTDVFIAPLFQALVDGLETAAEPVAQAAARVLPPELVVAGQVRHMLAVQKFAESIETTTRGENEAKARHEAHASQV